MPVFGRIGTCATLGRHMCAGILAFAGLTGCATTRPVAYADLASSRQLHPNPQDRTGRVPYRYSTEVDWHKYRKVMVDPATIYQGADAQFGKVSSEDRVTLTAYMDVEFREQLATTFDLTMRPGPDTLRIRITLTGARSTVPVLGTFSRFDLAGGPYNAVQSARGREGTLTGSVIYAIELFDGESGRLVDAQITKQFPSPTNIGASFGALTACKAGVRRGARELTEMLRRRIGHR